MKYIELWSFNSAQEKSKIWNLSIFPNNRKIELSVYGTGETEVSTKNKAPVPMDLTF